MLRVLAVSVGFCDTWHAYQGYANVLTGDNGQSAPKGETKIPVQVTRSKNKTNKAQSYVHTHTNTNECIKQLLKSILVK